MSQRQSIPSDVYSMGPLRRETTGLMHVRSVYNHRIRARLASGNIVVLEGEKGCGKTTIGNYFRFTNEDKFLTPNFEVTCEPQISQEDFMHVVLASVIKELFSNQSSIYSSISNATLVQSLKTRYEDYVERNISLGLGGFSVGGGATVNRSQSIGQAQLKSEMADLGKIIRGSQESKDSKILIQLDNFDYNIEGSNFKNKEEVIKFFSTIRDVLLIPNYSWIINGTKNLVKSIKLKESGASDIFPSPITVDDLTYEDIKSIVGKRLAFYTENSITNYPIEESLNKKIYELTKPSIRQYLSNLALLNALDETDEEISIELVSKKMLELRAEFKELDDTKKKILITLSKNDVLNQKKLQAKSNINQTTLSRHLKEMEADSMIIVESVGKNKFYSLGVEEFICARGLANT